MEYEVKENFISAQRRPLGQSLLICSGYLGTAALQEPPRVPSLPRSHCAASCTFWDGTPWRRPLLDKVPPCCGGWASHPRHWTVSTHCRCCRARPRGTRQPCSGQLGPDTLSPHGQYRLFHNCKKNASHIEHLEAEGAWTRTHQVGSADSGSLGGTSPVGSRTQSPCQGSSGLPDLPETHQPQ